MLVTSWLLSKVFLAVKWFLHVKGVFQFFYHLRGVFRLKSVFGGEESFIWKIFWDERGSSFQKGLSFERGSLDVKGHSFKRGLWKWGGSSFESGHLTWRVINFKDILRNERGIWRWMGFLIWKGSLEVNRFFIWKRYLEVLHFKKFFGRQRDPKFERDLYFRLFAP